MVAVAARPPFMVAAAVVGAFAIFHGAAHGAELPPGANVLGYFLGFVAATGMLHLLGIGFGLLARWRGGRVAVRAAGGAIAFAGLLFLFQAAGMIA
jgi:urease accessory protein